MIKKMVMEYTHIQTADAIKANGAMANNMARGCLSVLKELVAKANGKVEKDYIGKMKLILSTTKLNILLDL
jgi:hypothetical protein